MRTLAHARLVVAFRDRVSVVVGFARRICGRRIAILLVLALALTLLVLALGAGPAGADDVYANIAPASQLQAGSLAARYPISHYQLDQYFPAIKASLLGGVSVSGVPAMIAYFIAQVIWLVTAFVANALITLFSFAFSLNLLTGNGATGSGALAPVAQAIHSLYVNTFGAPWLIAAVVAVGCWAMYKALVQRRYAQTAAALGVSLIYCVAAIAIVTQPQRTIAPASKLTNELSTALLSATGQGKLQSESEAKTTASNQLFGLLVYEPWTVLEFGGIEHCATQSGGKTVSVAVRPLSSDPSSEAALSAQLTDGSEVHSDGKTCINNANKYAPHFLAYAFQSPGRNSEHEALEKGDDADLPASDASKSNGSYPLGWADEPAAEAMGQGGQYQRLLLAVVIGGGELGAFLLLGALSLAIILAQLLLLLLLAFAPVALLVGIFPGRGHDFFRAWLSRLGGYLVRKVIYSLILAVVLAVCRALDDSTSNLGWLMSFALQAAFLWAVFLQRERLSGDLLSAASGSAGAQQGLERLQSLYYASRLTRVVTGRHEEAPPPPVRARDTGPKTKTPAPQTPPPPAPTQSPPSPAQIQPPTAPETEEPRP